MESSLQTKPVRKIGSLSLKIKSILGRKILHHFLKKITIGELKITYESQKKISRKTYCFGDPSSSIKAHLIIYNPGVIWDMITLGDLGLGMGYVNDGWNSESPYHVLLVLLLNESKFRNFFIKAYQFDFKAFRMVKKYDLKYKNNHLIEHCKKQIGLTYDTGNDFYHAMLGNNMMFSCAIWPDKNATLDEAQLHKAKIIIDKLSITHEHKVLDIGCGWGTLCNYIQTNTHARVKGIALSHNQINACKKNFTACEFEYKDYREEKGKYDRIVSTGMVEHVGVKNLPVFMQSVSDLLEQGGVCLLHLMVLHDSIFMNEKRERYPAWNSVLMPNADTPTIPELIKAVMGTGILRIIHTELFSIHYARTAAVWAENLKKNKEVILKNYSDKIRKAHEFSCFLGSAAMETGTGLVQLILKKEAYGTDYTESVVDPVHSRTSTLSKKFDPLNEFSPYKP